MSNKLTYRQEWLLDMMKMGARLWRPSLEQTGWLCLKDKAIRVRVSTIRSMEEAGAIELDDKHSTWHANGAMDEVYKVKEQTNEDKNDTTRASVDSVPVRACSQERQTERQPEDLNRSSHPSDQDEKNFRG